MMSDFASRHVGPRGQDRELIVGFRKGAGP